MIKIEDLKYINSIDKDFGDFTLNMITESVNSIFDQIKEQDDVSLDPDTLSEVEAFYTSVIHIMEESEMYEECVKAYYILEAIKIQKEKLQNETESL